MRLISGGNEAVAAWEMLLAEATSKVFKVELLQDYTAIDDGPSLQAWMAGDTKRAKELAREQMLPWLEQRRAMGVEVRRIRIIEEPFTRYLDWEIACLYPVFEETRTERIELIHRTKASAVQLPSADYWTFDDRVALQWIFGDRNKTMGALITDHPDELAWYLDIERGLSTIIQS